MSRAQVHVADSAHRRETRRHPIDLSRQDPRFSHGRMIGGGFHFIFYDLAANIFIAVVYSRRRWPKRKFQSVFVPSFVPSYLVRSILLSEHRIFVLGALSRTASIGKNVYVVSYFFAALLLSLRLTFASWSSLPTFFCLPSPSDSVQPLCSYQSTVRSNRRGMRSGTSPAFCPVAS